MNSTAAAQQQIEQFLDAVWLSDQLAAASLAAYRRDLTQWAAWLAEQGQTLVLAERSALERYFTLLAAQPAAGKHHHRLGQQARGKSRASLQRLASSLRRFYFYLQLQGERTDNPAQDLQLERFSRPIPLVLQEDEVEALLRAPDASSALGLRDQALLELLYATGLRVSELTVLQLGQLNLTAGVVTVVSGKGGKGRLVPLGDKAVVALNLYIERARPQLVAGRAVSPLLVNAQGDGLTRQGIWLILKRLARQAGIAAERLSPHGLRHAFATHLLNHGADLRVIQLLLGHSDITSTQIYTQVAKARLVSLHRQHHPRG